MTQNDKELLKGITEDYVSFEVAKLLKDKGFNDPFTHMFINKDNVKFDCSSSGVVPKETIACPTHQMAMKWLREVHNLYIDIRININNSLYSFKIYSVGISGVRAFTEYKIKSYEEACETGIKYCLEHLI